MLFIMNLILDSLFDRLEPHNFKHFKACALPSFKPHSILNYNFSWTYKGHGFVMGFTMRCLFLNNMVDSNGLNPQTQLLYKSYALPSKPLTVHFELYLLMDI